jgi:hypothetical protein
MGFTLLSDCSFQIGLDSSDFFLFVSYARNPRRYEAHGAGQHFKKNYELPCIALVFKSEHKVGSPASTHWSFLIFFNCA